MPHKTKLNLRRIAFRSAVSISALMLLANLEVSKVAPAYADTSTMTQDGAPHEVQSLKVDGYINAVAWNKDGSRLAALSKFGSVVTLWDTTNWKVLNEFKRDGGGYSNNSLAFLPNGDLLMTAPPTYLEIPHDGTMAGNAQMNAAEKSALNEWNAETGKDVREFPDLNKTPEIGWTNITITNTFAVSPRGDLVAAVGGKGVLIFDTTNHEVVKLVHLPPNTEGLADVADSLAFSPDGKELAIGTISGLVQLFSIGSGSLNKTINAYPQDYRCPAIAFSPDGRLLAVGKAKEFNVANPNNIAATVWDVNKGTQVAALEGATWTLNGKDEAVSVRTVSWDKKTNLLAVGDDRSLRVWRVAAGEATLLLNKNISRGSFSTAFSPHGQLAATDNNHVTIYQPK